MQVREEALIAISGLLVSQLAGKAWSLLPLNPSCKYPLTSLELKEVLMSDPPDES